MNRKTIPPGREAGKKKKKEGAGDQILAVGGEGKSGNFPTFDR